MTTVTIKINTRSKKTQHLLGLITEIAKHDKNVEIIENESPYNADFVKEINTTRKSKGRAIDTSDLWK